MRILVVGGGSGGHLTPALAILEVLARKEPHLKVVFVCDKKFAPQAKVALAAVPLPVELHIIAAGKLRRYHGVPLWKQLIDLPTVVHNLVDICKIAIGIFQSWWLLRRFKPDVVFAKGGFVCLPVGIAAYKRRIPLVIHDSDAHPGLTNRILARFATFITTGAPLENYSYDPKRSQYVGIPVGAQFAPVPASERPQLKKELGLDSSRPLVIVTGGGLGAQRVNAAVVACARVLVHAGVSIVHVAGAGDAANVRAALKNALTPDESEFYRVEGFINPTKMAAYLKVADVVVSRAGATAMAELAQLGKAAVLVPNPLLTGGHQLKNAEVFAKIHAAEVIDEGEIIKDNKILSRIILQLVADNSRRHMLEKAITAFARPHAAEEVAAIITRVQQGREG